MKHSVGLKIFDLQERVLFDPGTELLNKEYKYYKEQLQQHLETMTEGQKEAVFLPDDLWHGHGR